MFESFFTAFIIYFVVIDPIGNLADFPCRDRGEGPCAETPNRAEKHRLRHRNHAVLRPVWGLDTQLSQHHRGRAFKIANSIILLLVALDILGSKRQQRKRAESKGGGTGGETSADGPDGDNLPIYLLAIPLLADPSAIMSVIIVNAEFAGTLTSTLTG